MHVKTIKKMLLFTAVILCSPFIVSAQSKSLKQTTPEQRAKMQTEWMRTKLALNTKQVEQVYALNLQYAQKNDPIIQSNEGRLSKFKKMKALQNEKSNAMSQILDAGQYKKYQEAKDQMIQNIKGKRP
ncbi:hypothetical protein [Chryseobacterium bernardetii]|uniref:DUF4890 domain-containing protein n=2 Tax=Chryseobacterium group TaxID=2782232 RepID=A0A3G6TJA9_9FLAO|nr:hypothetical protein [Chryseobacterium bernardetii]AZB26180.1 hypothetical protein EG339_17070 [Chryseobacterium bernardetii]AZB32693.1 hypothetical protein EG351_02970 [Chryseobacterium bernardetii]